MVRPGQTKTPRAKRLRANKMSVVPPEFGKIPALIGAKTPLPGNGGTTVAAYYMFSPMLRDDFSDRYPRTYTNRSLSALLLPGTASLPCSSLDTFVSIIYPFWIVKSQDRRKISFFRRDMIRFSRREI